MTILDASTVINLLNGAALELVLRLDSHRFAIGPMVLRECGLHEAQLQTFVAAGLLTVVNDDLVSANQFLVLLERYGLGDGETECLAVAALTGASMCCDDAAARRAATDLVGSHRLSGSLGLLREAVRQGRLSSDRAFAAYEQMRAKGGFLPEATKEFFDGDANLATG